MKIGALSIIFLILIGLVLGLLIIGLPVNITLLTLTGISIFYLAFAYPVAVIAFLLFLGPFNILWIGIGITPLEAIYGFTFLILIVSWLSRRIIAGIFSAEGGSASGGKGKTERLASPISVPLAVFFAMTIIACIIGVLKGHKFQHWGSDLNTIMYYGLCFIMLDLVKDKKMVYRLFSLTVIAMVLGLLKAMYDVARIAQIHHLGTQILSAQHITLTTTNLTGLAMFIISVALSVTLAKGRKKSIFMLLSLFFGMMLLASFARSLWVSAIFGLAVLFFISSGKQKLSFAKLVLVTIILFSLCLSIAASFPSHNPLAKFFYDVEERYKSFFTARTEYTMISRDAEKQAAMKRAMIHPIFGNGLGTQITFFRYDQWFGKQTWYTTRYIHNVYMYLFLNMGLAGLLAFLWFCMSFVKYGLGLYRSLKDEMDRGLTLGITCAFLSLMVASLAGVVLIAPVVTIWFGFFAGALIIIDRSRKAEETKV
ncbi:MAG: O-antigen ligase family protein [Candidatus Omnitrophica bacterium]|nr:O-antigen ligase family protein [Candidatus Omnitrophota bacterium]